MTATIITTAAKERSTYKITVAVTDDAGSAATPSTMTWTLTDTSGNVINSREDIDFEADNGAGDAGTLSESMDIVLTGADLQITGTGDVENRVLTIEGTYSSDAGSDLAFKDRCKFPVDNLVAVTT